MQKIPFTPIDAGYELSFNDGVTRIALEGGGGRYRADILGGTNIVNATWGLCGDEYSMFMAFVRRWARSGGERFEIDLIIDSADEDTYPASFIPGTVSLQSKQGQVFFVTAQLEVWPLQKYLDPEEDVWAIIAELLPYYGSVAAIRELFNELEKLVNYDWPS